MIGNAETGSSTRTHKAGVLKASPNVRFPGDCVAKRLCNGRANFLTAAEAVNVSGGARPLPPEPIYSALLLFASRNWPNVASGAGAARTLLTSEPAIKEADASVLIAMMGSTCAVHCPHTAAKSRRQSVRFLVSCA